MKQVWLSNTIKFSIAAVTSSILAIGVGSQAALSQRFVDVYPRLEGQNITADTPVYGVFEPTNGVGVAPQSVRIFINNRDVTQNSTITNGFFIYRPQQNLPLGSNTVRVEFEDTVGQSKVVNWNFTVDQAASASSYRLPEVQERTNAQTPTQDLRPVFLSHRSGDEINTRGFTLEGQTQPNATVDVKVTSALPVLGGIFDVKVGQSTLVNQTVTADSNGRFEIQVPTPPSVSSGLRYNVTAVATKGAQTSRPVELTLVQD